MLRVALVLAASLVLAGPARAQTVEYELPTSIEVVPGKLSVTFADTVAAEAAQALVASLGYRVEAVNFYDVQVTARADTTLGPGTVARLEADPRVRGVAQRVLHAPEDAPDYVRAHYPAYEVVLALDPALHSEAARAFATAVPGLRDVRVRKLPNDLVVAVDDEAAALEAFEASALVAYVTYLAE